MAHPPLLIAAASRPYPGETENGDAWTVEWQAGGCRVALIDGLGHGPAAAAAARAAVATLAARPDAPPDEALRLCHEALRTTRGAAISIVRVAADRLTFAGAGNVDALLWQADHGRRLLPARGIVGAVLPTLRPVALDLAPGWLLLLHTDGVSARLDFEALVPTARDPQDLADTALAAWARATDDATVLVARPAPEHGRGTRGGPAVERREPGSEGSVEEKERN